MRIIFALILAMLVNGVALADDGINVKLLALFIEERQLDDKLAALRKEFQDVQRKQNKVKADIKTMMDKSEKEKK